jgi:hypothetical protein
VITVPKSTAEKPLTAIDYIAELERCRSLEDVRDFGEQVPMRVRQDSRFTRAVAKRLAAIKELQQSQGMAA